ncbi:L,D-transpeptidase [Aliterella atlantica]|uniref:L,D-TPase catalytic domain-containing protein n=1 Tax=Aliterella atlantica CENA595 TaxID=1618023 RepID=A0A0D8ZSP2_9CYAN|nr:L,D-transpeptidase [Aliterella atlantica]KJH70236.1 hypothetical protein UH38_18955 [Aliterella atlantica CENA595]
MLTKVALALLSCLVSMGCAVHSESKQSLKIVDVEQNKNLQVTGISSTKNQQQLINSEPLPATQSEAESSQFLSIKPLSSKQWQPSEEVLEKVKQKNYNSEAQLTATVNTDNYLTLKPTGRTNALGNPLYQLRLYANGQLIGTYTTVSGRAYTQNRNRNRAGTEAPLPDGNYKISKTTIPGTIAEAGERFLPIQPLFRTGRSALGIHYDPSFEKDNGEDGTSGCVALTNKQDLNQVLNYVRTYQPKYLKVNIQ